MKQILCLLTAILFMATTQAQHIPKGSLVDTESFFEYAIYYLDAADADINHVKAVVQEKYPEITILEEFPNPEDVEGSQLFLTLIENVKEDYVAQDLETLEYFGMGLNGKQKEDYQESERVIILDFFCQAKDCGTTLANANQILLDVTKELSKNEVFLWDEMTRETYTKDYWKELRADSDINQVYKHTTIHFYQTSDFCRAITLGMIKYGLPDVYISDFPCSGDGLESFMNLITQTMYEKGRIENDNYLALDIDELKDTPFKESLLASLYDNAEKKGGLVLTEGLWEDGDPDNRLIEIYFPEKDKQIAQMAFLDKLFGADDEIVHIAHNDELLAASADAKKQLKRIYKIFSKDEDKTHRLLMKFPFETDNGGEEWMWIEVIEWKGKTVNGLLQNNPYYISDLKAGAKVTKNTDDMFDYILYYPDGKEEGNKTSEIIMKMQ